MKESYSASEGNRRTFEGIQRRAKEVADHPLIAEPARSRLHTVIAATHLVSDQEYEYEAAKSYQHSKRPEEQRVIAALVKETNAVTMADGRILFREWYAQSVSPSLFLTDLFFEEIGHGYRSAPRRVVLADIPDGKCLLIPYKNKAEAAQEISVLHQQRYGQKRTFTPKALVVSSQGFDSVFVDAVTGRTYQPSRMASLFEEARSAVIQTSLAGIAIGMEKQPHAAPAVQYSVGQKELERWCRECPQLSMREQAGLLLLQEQQRRFKNPKDLIQNILTVTYGTTIDEFLDTLSDREHSAFLRGVEYVAQEPGRI